MKIIFLILLFFSCFDLQAKINKNLPSVKPQNLSEIKLKIVSQDEVELRDVPLIEKTTLDMQEAVQIALQNKPDLKAYQYAIEEGRMRSKQALSGYLPTISMTGNVSQTRGQSNPTSNVDFLVQQLVINFAGPIEQYKRAKKVKEVVEYQNEIDKKNIRHEIGRASCRERV